MKSLTLFSIAALSCAVSAQHHGGLDHLDHNIGHLDHDQSGHYDHGRDPRPVPVATPAALDFEIQTKPPVVVLTTVTMTKPFAVLKPHHYPTDVPAVVDETPEPTKEAKRPFRGHDRDHSNHVHDDHDRSQDHRRTRTRQKAVKNTENEKTNEADEADEADEMKEENKVHEANENKEMKETKEKINSIASEKTPEKLTNNHLAAAAVSANAATSAVRAGASSKPVVRPVTSAHNSSGSDQLRVGGTLVATAGVIAWLLL